MPKTTACAILAAIGLAATANGQIRLSQTLVEDLVTAGSGVACASGTGPILSTKDNRWSRSFTLADFGVEACFTVHTVEFGVEDMRLPTLPEGEVTINLYQIPAGSPPITGGELVGSTTLVYTPDAVPQAEVISVGIDATVEAGTALMVEIALPNFVDLAGGEFGDAFFIGGNNFGYTAPSYIASTDCGLPEPIAPPDCHWSDCSWIIIAEGRVIPDCRADFDGDAALTIFDFLAFQNAFDARDPIADFDFDGEFTIFDFLIFQNEFDAGCV